MPTEDVVVRVISSTSDAAAGLKKYGQTAQEELGASGRVGKAAKESEGAMGAAKEGGKGLLEGLTGLSVASLGFAAAAGGIVEVGKGVFEAWNKQDEAVTSLRQAMKDAGEKETPAFESALRKAQLAGEDLGFSEDQTTAALAQMRLAGIDTATAMKDLPTIMDLSRAKGIDLASATTAVVQGMQGQGRALKQLNVELPAAIPKAAALAAAQKQEQAAADAAGKAYTAYSDAVTKHGEGSAQAQAADQKYVDALTKVHDATAKVNQIQADQTDRTGNLAQVMDLLNSKVGGQAQAHTHDLGVMWDSLKSKFNDFAGQAIPYVLDALGHLLDGFEKFIGWIANDMIPWIHRALDSGAWRAWVNVVVGIFNVVKTTAIISFNVISTAVRVLISVFTVVFNIIKGVVQVGVAVLAPIIGTLVGIVSGVISVLTTIFQVGWAIISTYVGTYIKIITTVIGTIVDVVSTVVGTIGGIIGKVAGFFSDYIIAPVQHVIDFLKGPAQAIGTIFGAIFDGVKNVVLAPFRAIATAWNDTLGSINFTIPGWVPGIGGKGFGFPKIPSFDTGGFVPGAAGAPMLAVVHGGEQVLTPAQQAARQAGGTSSSSNLTVNVTTGPTQADPTKIASAVVWGLRYRARVAGA